MKTFKLSESGDRGWFVGQFEKAVFKTDILEAALQFNEKDTYSPRHYHKVATEINLIVSGKAKYNDIVVEAGNGIIVYPGEESLCYYLEDTETMVIKIPGVLNDKYVIED